MELQWNVSIIGINFDRVSIRVREVNSCSVGEQ